MARSPNDLAPMVVAWQWVTRITTVSIEMVLPGLAGYWLDDWLGTRVLFMLAGFALGGTLAMWHLLRMTSQKPRSDAAESDRLPPKRNDKHG